MIVLCVDPGIRNLSLCIMNSEYNILLWDTFNTLDGDDYHCKGVFKNGKICNRKCNMKYKNQNKEFIYTCKSHFPKEIVKTKNNNFKKKNIDDYTLQDLALLFTNKLQDIYDSSPAFKVLTSILIELQPKCNPKSLFISHMIYSKFIELYKNTIPIKFVRASKKLRAYTGPHVECNLKGGYARRKWLGIKYGEWFLENKFSKEQRDIWKPTLVGKVDDRHDSFLMCINAIAGLPKKQITNKNGKCIK